MPVRRLFIMIEESCKKSTGFAVFEPNTLTTWLKVKGMIDSFLYGLWQHGALAGAKPEDAYFVNVGLGKTMTPQDVLEDDDRQDWRCRGPASRVHHPSLQPQAADVITEISPRAKTWRETNGT